MPKQLKSGVWRVEQGQREDGGGFVRLLLPSRGRLFAPCRKESNLCCGGKKAVHLRPQEDLVLPAVQWLRVRVSSEEWSAFIAALDAANLEGTILFYGCVLFPCAFPLLPIQPLCCCLPYQYVAGKAVRRQNALHLAVAKYNRYLFMPRGILLRRQRDIVEFGGDEIEYNFLRLDFVGQAAAYGNERLPQGIRPGTMPQDIEDLTRQEWLATPYAFPGASIHPLCALRLCIPTPHAFYRGNEAEIQDAELDARFGMRNAEFAGVIRPDAMLRA